MAATGFHADVPYRLIQSIRLVHALMESVYRVHIPAEHADKFSRLRDVFGVDFSIGIAGVPELPAVVVSHAEPLTSIGPVQRPLIFPHAIVERCRDLWAADRSVNVSFAGLVTAKRRAVLDQWVRHALPQARTRLADRTLFDRFKSRLRRSLGGRERVIRADADDLTFWSSDRGRHFPGKSWDDEYQTLLGRSRFVLCPSGDFVWSYRFFEAALCGAIPIVERSCPAYSGFRYRTMDEPLTGMPWRIDDAQHNFALCQERLTVPHAELNAAIESLLVSHRAATAAR